VGLDVRLLGPLEIREGAQTVVLTGEKPRALLIALALQAGETVTTDELIEALWGGQPPATAAATLQMHVAKLRKTLGRDSVATEAVGYRLAVPPEAVDAKRFEQRLAAGRAALQSGDEERAAVQLRKALALWRGRVLADVAYAEFAQAERRRLEELRLEALEERFEADLGCGRGEELVAELETLIADEPLRERPRRQLIVALYRAGRQADALEAYAKARALLLDEFGIDPGPELQELQRRILNQDPSLLAPVSRRSGPRIPAPPTPLVGRSDHVHELASLISGSRLVTLTGPGGVGKTRLALEAAHRADEELPGGARFVALAPLREPGEVVSEIARAFGADGTRLDAISAAVAAPTLLVLDNFEHLVGAAAEVASLVAACPDVHVLVTSRERLRIRGERELAVAPLALDEAVELLRARAEDGGVALDPTPVLEQLCDRLDRLPLALELAAARARLLSPEELLQRIGERLDLLRGSRDMDARQSTLRAAIEWSHDLLSEEERALFRRLAVFEDGFALAAAEHATDADLDGLQALLDKSLLAGTGSRFAMLETIRQYALERLEDSGEEMRWRERHCTYFEELSLQARAELDANLDRDLVVGRLDADYANIRAALAWAKVSDPRRFALLAVALAKAWTESRHLRQIASLLAEAIELLDADDEALVARCRCWFGAAALKLGQADRASEALDASIAWYRLSSQADDPELAVALLCLGTIALDANDLDAAQSLFEEALAAAQAALADGIVLSAMGDLASVAERRGDHVRALELFREIADTASERADLGSRAWALSNAGLIALHTGALEFADQSLAASIELLDRLGWQEGLAYSLNGLAGVALALGDTQRALDLEAAAIALGDSIGLSWQGEERELRDATVASLTTTYRTLFEAVWAEAVQRDASAVVADEIARHHREPKSAVRRR